MLYELQALLVVWDSSDADSIMEVEPVNALEYPDGSVRVEVDNQYIRFPPNVCFVSQSSPMEYELHCYYDTDSNKYKLLDLETVLTVYAEMEGK